VTFTANAGDFLNLPTTAQPTNASGEITVSNLIAAAAGNPAVTVAAVNGAAVSGVSLTFTVAAGNYTLEASPNALTRGLPASVVFTLKESGNPVPAGTSVTFTANAGDFLNLPTTAQLTNASGEITVSNLIAAAAGNPAVTVAAVNGVSVSGASVIFMVAASTLTLVPSGNYADSFVTDPYESLYRTATFTAQLNGQAINGTITEAQWTVSYSNVSAEAWNRPTGARNGLYWTGWTGSYRSSGVEADATTAAGSAPDASSGSASLADIVGSRTVTVAVTLKINGVSYSADSTVTFADGPLSVFKMPVTGLTWDAAYNVCNGTSYVGDHKTGWGDNAYVGGPGGNGTNTNTGKMPTFEQMHIVSSGSQQGSRGAAYAAGWPGDFPNYSYWTGQSNDESTVTIIYINTGVGFTSGVGGSSSVACRR
jgi:sulfur carrier protein ThiS